MNPFTLRLIFIGLILHASSISSYGQITFRKFTIDDGIEGYNRFVVNQDSFGGIWLATEEGLFRYDDGNFERHRYMSYDNTYTSEKIIFATVDVNKNFIISTVSDVRVFNPYSLETEVIFDRPVGDIVCFPTCVLLKEDDMFYRFDYEFNKCDTLRGRYTDVSNRGKTLYLGDENKRLYKTTDGINILLSDDFNHEEIKNKINVEGKYFYGDNYTEQLIYHSKGVSDTISYDQLDIEHIHTLYEYDDNSCWLHSNKGLYYVVYQEQVFENILDEKYITARQIWRSKDRVVFSGESAIGYIEKEEARLKKSKYTVMDHVRLDEDGCLAVLSIHTLGLMDSYGNITEEYDVHVSNTDKSGMCLQQVSDSTYLVGTRGGLFLFNRNNITSTELPIKGYEDVPIYDIVHMGSDRYVLGTALGAISYTYGDDIPSPLFPQYRVPIYDIHRYGDEVIYSTNGAGVIIADTAGSVNYHIDTEDGLSHQECYATYKIGDNKYITSTRYGLSIYDLDKSEYYVYTQASGLPFNEFNRNSHFHDTLTNTLYFGGVGGIIRFSIDDISLSQLDLETTLSSILHERKGGSQVVPYKSLFNKPGFHLKENDRLSISLSHPSYLAKRNTQYRYAINDDPYISLGSGNKINISALNEGQNVIKIQSRAYHEPWTSSSRELYIRYTPVVYKRRWFSLLMVGLSLGLLYLLYRFRLRILEQKNLTLANQKKAIWKSIEKEKKLISSRLHDDVGQQIVALKISAAHTQAENLSEELDTILDRLRKASEDIYPYDLSLGLNSAVQKMANRLNTRTDVYFSVDLQELESALTTDQALLVYRIIQESWTNTLKHSGASSARVSYDHNEHAIVIRDNGKGLAEHVDLGVGLTSLEDKVSLLGGTYKMYNDNGLVLKVKLETTVKTS